MPFYGILQLVKITYKKMQNPKRFAMYQKRVWKSDFFSDIAENSFASSWK
ncbi:protein of unknown function [Maridesulfovibrio hydrothermalis AM13 = DSM 14728]|uniref:Uncharacterized protein n=1 Tax=Maridesulfovibrio hydrothermalis AM13 = DSM 14728 TaxID=1121451 RepID=L0R7D9_9BACT|nr:protein of unknown function [Maridesulfovibrio hydrothermalis AM13 = DSM 14728]